jgi:hypothetical protein
VSSRDARIVRFTTVPAAETSGRPIKFETFRTGDTVETGRLFVVAPIDQEEEQMNLKFPLIGRGRFETFFDRKIREQRRDERRLAELCTIKHQLLARNSCVADARSYRIARRLPVKVW